MILLTLLALAAGGAQAGGADPACVVQDAHCLSPDPRASVTCESPFLPIGTQCLFFATFSEGMYNESQQVCHSMDAELATVTTASQYKAFIDYVNNNGLSDRNYWFDGNDMDRDYVWVQGTGQPVPMGTPFWAVEMYGEQDPFSYECMYTENYLDHYFRGGECYYSFTPVCEQAAVVSKDRAQISTYQTTPVPYSTTAAPLDCPSFFVEVGGVCLSFMTWADEYWFEARQSCHGLQAELATINDPDLLRAIYLYVNQEGIANHNFWVGGSDEATEGVWLWTDGSPVPRGAPFWGTKYWDIDSLEPDGGTYENCVRLDAGGFHYFRDVNCYSTGNPLCLYA